MTVKASDERYYVGSKTRLLVLYSGLSPQGDVSGNGSQIPMTSHRYYPGKWVSYILLSRQMVAYTQYIRNFGDHLPKRLLVALE